MIATIRLSTVLAASMVLGALLSAGVPQLSHAGIACSVDADCDDGNGCTLDRCFDQNCTYATCDQLSPVPDCVMFVCDSPQPDSASACIAVADEAQNGSGCDDGDECNDGETCSAGECGGGAPVDCSALDGDCTVGACDPADGQCVAEAANEGGGCDDGDECNDGEICSAGVCGGGAPVDCSALDGDCTVGACDPADGQCVAEAANEGGGCDDGDECNDGETCSAGVCGGGTAVDCSGLDEECVEGVCQPDGSCLGVPIDTPECNNACDSDTDCSDGDGCTLDQCIGGQCAFAGCDELMPVPACQQFVCDGDVPDPANECVPIADESQNDAECDDTDPCSVDDVCSAGVCSGAPKDCSALDADCTVGVCNAGDGQCVAAAANEGGGCDDGDECNDGETCTAGVCGGGSAVDCSGLDEECVEGVCQSDGSCLGVPIDTPECNNACDSDTDCDDGDGCTLDQCIGGQCAFAGCDELMPVPACQQFICDGDVPDPANECVAVADDSQNDAECDDTDPCTIDDACSAGTCSGTPKDCSALDGDCAVGVCDVGDGQCVAAAANEGGGCDDGDECNDGETCSAGVCDGGSAVDCSGLDEDCVEGVCQTDGSCLGVPIDTPECNNACDSDVDCDDENGCTLDKCIEGQCAFASCSELIPQPQCQQFVCSSPTPGPADECVPEADAAQDGEGCDDEDLCTENDSCDGGSCVGTPKDCSPLDEQCSVGFCDEQAGVCTSVAANEGEVCSTGIGCSDVGVCRDGICVGDGTGGEDCDDGDPCTLDRCNQSGECESVGAVAQGCFDPRQSFFFVRDSRRDDQDRVRYSWKSGDAFAKGVLGSPRDDTQYALCVFESFGGAPDLAMSLVVDPSNRWQMHRNRWRYRDASAAQDGVHRIDLEPEHGHDGKVAWRAAGSNIPLPGPFSPADYFSQDETVIVQVVNSDGVCWSTTFDRRDTKKNRSDMFIAVLDQDGDSDSDSDSGRGSKRRRVRR